MYNLISIQRKPDITLLGAAVTDFTGALGYCEYKIPLSIKGVKPKPSQSLIMGTKAHHAEEKYEEEHVELEPIQPEAIADKSKDIEFAREDVYSVLNVPFEFPSGKVMLSLYGRIDKIMRIDETLIVQDDKFVGRPDIYDGKTRPYPDQMLQVLVYLNSLYSSAKTYDPEDMFDMPHAKKRWDLRICDRSTREPYKVFSEYQDDSSLRYLHASLERFATVALEISEPRHHGFEARCRACSLKDSCDFRI